MRNHEYYIDRTAGEAIRRTDRSGVKKEQHMPWVDRLTYRIGEVIKFLICLMVIII